MSALPSRSKIWKLLFVLSTCALVAMTCKGTLPGPSFSGSREVLRGNWAGAIQGDFSGTEFRFKHLEATRETDDSYVFEGVFELGSGLEARVEGTGQIETEFEGAGYANQMNRQLSPIRPPYLEFAARVISEGGAVLWEFAGATQTNSSSSLYDGTAKNLENGNTYRFVLDPIPEEYPDVIGFTSTPETVPVGTEAVFSWSAFDGGGGDLTCALSPGDASPDYLIENCASGTVQNHVYAESGVWEARLLVTNDQGNVAEAVHEVVVAGSKPGTLEWRFKTHDWLSAAPAVGPDGRIYFGTEDGNFIALAPDGTLRWHITFEAESRASPTIAADGTIYVDSSPYLYALDSNGEILWRHDMGGHASTSSAAIAQDGTIYVGSRDHHLYAINPDGTRKWRFLTENSSEVALNSAIEASPAVGADGTIFFGNEGGYFYALRPDGTLLWRYDIGRDLYASPAIAADGTIYVASRRSNDGGLFAFQPDGTLKWTYPIGLWVSSSPVIDAKGTVYIGSDYTQGVENAAIYAIDSTGALVWRFDTGSSAGISSTAAVGADGTIYMAGSALSEDGELQWRYPGSGTVKFGADQTVLFAAGDALHAVNVVAGGAQPGSAWPQFQRNGSNSGRQGP